MADVCALSSALLVDLVLIFIFHFFPATVLIVKSGNLLEHKDLIAIRSRTVLSSLVYRILIVLYAFGFRFVKY